MAFGKDKSQLGRVGSFGGNFLQKAKTQARRPERGGYAAPYWKDTYRPPDDSADIIRLIPGDYTCEVSHDGETVVQEAFPYYTYREHHNGKRGCICCAGPLFGHKGKAEYCPSCDLFWEDVAERKAKKARGDKTKGPNRMSARDLHAFTVWDYGLYFEVPQVDGQGNLRMNPKTNQPYTQLEKGDPNDPKYQGKPWKQGRLLAWSMGQTYLDTFVEWSKQVGKCCKSCGARDSIKTTAKICGNPECGAVVYDPRTTTLSKEQREQIDYYPYKCPHCQVESYVAEQIECSNCTSPAKATIFDVDFQVQRLKTQGQQTFLQIFTFSDPRPIQVADPEVLKTIKPLDLKKKFAPTPPQEQAKIYGFQLSPPAQEYQHMAPPTASPNPNIEPPVVPQMQPQTYAGQGTVGGAAQAADEMPAIPYSTTPR